MLLDHHRSYPPINLRRPNASKGCEHEVVSVVQVDESSGAKKQRRVCREFKMRTKGRNGKECKGVEARKEKRFEGVLVGAQLEGCFTYIWGGSHLINEVNRA